MKLIILLLLFAVSANAQIFFNGDRLCDHQTSAAFIPYVQFGYGFKHYEFVEKNTGMEVQNRQIKPSVYFGCQLLSDGYMVGVGFDPLNFGVSLSGGFVIPIKDKKKQKK